MQPARLSHVRWTRCFLLLCCLLNANVFVIAQGDSDSGPDLANIAWSTDSTSPVRFVSVHGRRAAVFGYSEDGLEVWAYPFQIVSSYTVSFRPQGTTSATEGRNLLRRIIYAPDSITRIYIGLDFIVRERIFVPLEEPGAIFQYDVESSRPIDIDVHFNPVLDLMWPGGIGGQEAQWESSVSGYLFSEPTHRFSAIISSPEILAHDETPNQARQVSPTSGLSFTLRAAEHGTARVIIAGGSEDKAIAIAKMLREQEGPLEKAATGHYSALLKNSLRIETPDEKVNRAVIWAEVALDQAWVCNPDLGCGLVAGYGPSRRARRPQYDWFFAGDGMVSMRGLLAEGQYDLARQELEFILKYRDRQTGMIWHELSQSAGWLDWNKYPYKFVHVELTFDFLSAVETYLSTTGDLHFVETHWSAIQSAYKYCESLIDPSDGLPRIPPTKEGSREQEQLSEELALSADWVTASQAFADLAAVLHNPEADHASAMSRKAREAIAQKYWDAKQNFWITGYTHSGSPLLDRQIGPVSILSDGMFSETQRDSMLQQLASSDYQTDWGTRGRASTSSTYDPNSYANGSVWAISTSAVSDAFWAAHRPATAFSIWSALVPWSSLDSLGHMHETLAGDFYHEEFESVPEQTWSSATFLSATVKGLLGLQVEGVSQRVTFAPHLPLSWNTVTLRNIRVGPSILKFELSATENKLELRIHNAGMPVNLTFDPEIPLGARLLSAQLQGRRTHATVERHAQDTHARVEFNLASGDELLTLNYTGGIRILPEVSWPDIGEPSQGVKITKVNLQGQTYTVDYDYVPAAGASFELQTPWTIRNVQGATFTRSSSTRYKLEAIVPPKDKSTTSYQHGQVRATFASTM